MLRNLKTFLNFTTLILGTSLCASYASAHFVWIESPSTLPHDQPSIVKAYFGEYNEALKEKTGGRLNERAGLTFWLIEPNGRKRSLDPTQKMNSFQILLQPNEPGTYHLIALDQDEHVRDGTPYPTIRTQYKPMFYARTQLSTVTTTLVLGPDKPVTDMLPLDIILTPQHSHLSQGLSSQKVNDEIRLQVVFQGHPIAQVTPIAYAPNGWSKELQTNDAGITQFIPLWPGIYVIDYVKLEKTPGEFQDQPYEAIRHRSTLTIHITEDQKG